jgi:hypothetical protein
VMVWREDKAGSERTIGFVVCEAIWPVVMWLVVLTLSLHPLVGGERAVVFEEIKQARHTRVYVFS